MICEYMFIREAGKKLAPSWIADGGYFQDPDDFTLIGWTPDQGVRDWYVPDTVVELTADELKARLTSIHARYPMTDGEGVELTIAQVEALADEWIAQRG